MGLVINSDSEQDMELNLRRKRNQSEESVEAEFDPSKLHVVGLV